MGYLKNSHPNIHVIYFRREIPSFLYVTLRPWCLFKQLRDLQLCGRVALLASLSESRCSQEHQAMVLTALCFVLFESIMKSNHREGSEQSSWGLLWIQSRSLTRAASHPQTSCCLSPKYTLPMWIFRCASQHGAPQLGLLNLANKRSYAFCADSFCYYWPWCLWEELWCSDKNSLTPLDTILI